MRQLYEEDVAESGYVWNVSRLWAHQPETVWHLFELMPEAFRPNQLAFRQRGILVAAGTARLGDSYCPLAWGAKLSEAIEPAGAARVPREATSGRQAVTAISGAGQAVTATSAVRG